MREPLPNRQAPPRPAVATARVPLANGHDERREPDQDGVARVLMGELRLEDFCEQVLGALAAYDREKRSELVRTLDAYVGAGNSLSAAAARLGLHRNTVLYRLRRIRALLGYDPDDPEPRLALQLALRARRLLADGAAG